MPDQKTYCGELLTHPEAQRRGLWPDGPCPACGRDKANGHRYCDRCRPKTKRKSRSRKAKLERFLERERQREGRVLTRELCKTEKDYVLDRWVRKHLGFRAECPNCDGTGSDEEATGHIVGADDEDRICKTCCGEGTVWFNPDGSLPAHEL